MGPEPITLDAMLENMDELRGPVRKLMERFGPDYWRKVDDERAFPQELFDAFGEAGYFATLIPEAYGGQDAGPRAASVVVEEINRAGGDAAVINAQMTICGTLVRDGSHEQKQRYLPDIASGKLRCLSVAATEPDSGADMTTLESRSRQDGDEWVIDARKVLISMAEHTELLFLLTQSDAGPTLFLLDMRELGEQFQIHPIDLVTNRMTTTLFVDGLRVGADTLIGEPGKGLACLMKGFAPRRILAAAEALGHARFMLDRSLEHAKERETYGRPIGQNQGVQYPLTHAFTKVEAADLMRWEALRQLEAGEDAGGRSAMAKVLASEAAWETARAALTAFGGWGLSGDYHIERKLRESTVFVFNNLLLSYIAQRVLELPKAF